MRTITRLEDLAGAPCPIIFAAGAFDGVHRGHQAVLRHAQALARRSGGQAWVLTFDPHPQKLLRPDRAPALITSTPHRLQLLRELGVEGVALLPFTAAFAAQEPEAYIARVRETVPALRAFVVGRNWTFGRLARGTTELLRALGGQYGFEVHALDGLDWGGAPISSTRIRHAIGAGALADAEAMLGRPFSICGAVVHGAKVGRQLGYPTANVDPHNEVRPPPGIYACRARIEGRTHPAAAFLAAHPDPRKGPPDVVEVHLIDAAGDLYGQEMDVQFVKKLRDERRFDSLDALKAQIALDVETARAALA